MGNGKRIIQYETDSTEIMDTEITQVAIFLTCVAYYRVLIEGSDILPDSYAGHSVGEYAALVCSGAMRFEDGLSLIRRRGQLMQKVSDDMGDGGMLAIVGMAYPEVEELTEACVKDGTEVFIEAGRGKVLSNLLKKNKRGNLNEEYNFIYTDGYSDYHRIGWLWCRPE